MSEAASELKLQTSQQATTNSNHHLPVAANGLAQDFSATAPNQKWVQDITDMAAGQGWLYWAVVIGWYSRQVRLVDERADEGHAGV